MGVVTRLIRFFRLTVISVTLFSLYPPLGMAHAQGAQSRVLERTIVLDPGHGGIDGGTGSGGLLEKHLTLDIAQRVKRHLPTDVFRVLMTRDTDTDVSQLYPSALSSRHRRDLQNRLTLVRQSRAVGLISIHINSSVNAGDRGPIVLFYTQSEAGKKLAMDVQSALNRISGSKQRPVGRTNLFLLRHAPCPAVLAEVGFVTNASDLTRLRDPVYREQVATAIAQATIAALRDEPVPPPFVRDRAASH